jgi:hypothetical protein
LGAEHRRAAGVGGSAGLWVRQLTRGPGRGCRSRRRHGSGAAAWTATDCPGYADPARGWWLCLRRRQPVHAGRVREWPVHPPRSGSHRLHQRERTVRLLPPRELLYRSTLLLIRSDRPGRSSQRSACARRWCGFLAGSGPDSSLGSIGSVPSGTRVAPLGSSALRIEASYESGRLCSRLGQPFAGTLAVPTTPTERPDAHLRSWTLAMAATLLVGCARKSEGLTQAPGPSSPDVSRGRSPARPPRPPWAW